MTLDDRGGAGVWEGPKKDDIIYEQPLISETSVHVPTESSLNIYEHCDPYPTNDHHVKEIIKSVDVVLLYFINRLTTLLDSNINARFPAPSIMEGAGNQS